MAIVQLQEPFKSFRGRDEVTGGQVLFPFFRRNVSRTFVQPANPQTTFQTLIRDLFTLLSQAYSDVTDNENEGWIELAKFLGHKDKDGNNVTVSAKAAYIQINFWNIIGGGSATDTAPTYAAVPGIFGASALKRTAADDGWQFTYTWTGANTGVAVKATSALPGLRRQPRKGDYRFATEDPTDSIKPVTSAGGTITILDADSRFPQAEDDRIGYSVQVINADGIPLQTFFFQGVIAAP